MNPYHYADNDPLNKTDPTGMRPDDDGFWPTYVDRCQDYGLGLMVTESGACGVSWTGEADWCNWPLHWGMCVKAAKLADVARGIARDYWSRNSSRWLAAGERGASCNTGGNLPGPDPNSVNYLCAPESSAGDAVMHMSWAALLTRAYGRSQAKEILDSHEAGAVAGDLGRSKRQMDLANNFYGQQLAEHIGPVDRRGKEYHSNSWKWALAAAVERFVNAGGACTLRKVVRDGVATFVGDFVDRSRCGLRG